MRQNLTGNIFGDGAPRKQMELWTRGQLHKHDGKGKKVEDTTNVQAHFSEILGELLERLNGVGRAKELHLLLEELIEKAPKLRRIKRTRC